MKLNRMPYYLLGLLATQSFLVGSLVIPDALDICNPSLQLCLNNTVADEVRTVEVTNLDRRAGGGGGKGGKGKDPEPVPGGGNGGGGDAPSTPGGSTGNGGFETGETSGGFQTAETEGGFGQAPEEPAPVAPIEPKPPIAPEPAPAPGPKTQPGRSNRAGEGALIVQNSRALATLERWKCGKTKRTRLFGRLFKRAFTSADAEDPAKYLEWLENMATDDHGNKFPRDKIVFWTRGTDVMADSFLNTNPGYHGYFEIFGSQSFFKHWEEVDSSTPKQDAAKSQALARYARNPLVFGAEKTISSTDKSYWANHEWPYMQDAGTITKLKDNALSPTEVDYEIAPPEKKC